MAIVVFEDEQVRALHPATLSRPAYSINCGSYCLVELLRGLSKPLYGIVRPHLLSLQRRDEPDLFRELEADGEPILYVNARAVPSIAVLESLRRCLQRKQAGVIETKGVIAAVLLTRAQDAPLDDPSPSTLRDFFREQKVQSLDPIDETIPLMEYPHDIVRFNMETLSGNLEHRLATGGYRELQESVFAAGEVALAEHVVVDPSGGPIVLEEGVSIGPFSFLRGPAHIGRNAKVIEHAAIKDDVAIGHTTKIGGEVEASVIEAFTNKQHHGFLGHSYLGSWINLGAGTCNSDLKNTYGKVNMEYQGRRVATKMQFVGCIVGDYSKSAINTGIFTGKVIGVCSMLYGFVTTNVPSFVNYARLFGQVTELPAEVMIATQQRMFRRRGVEQTDLDAQLIRDMYDLTREDRQLAGEPLAL